MPSSGSAAWWSALWTVVARQLRGEDAVGREIEVALCVFFIDPLRVAINPSAAVGHDLNKVLLCPAVHQGIEEPLQRQSEGLKEEIISSFFAYVQSCRIFIPAARKVSREGQSAGRIVLYAPQDPLPAL